MAHNHRLAYSVDEVAKLLGLGRNTTYEAVWRGQIPSVRVGRRLLVPRRALEEFLARDEGIRQLTGGGNV